MVKESKSAATIRRRRKKTPNDVHFRHKSHNMEDCDFTEEDPEVPMDAPELTSKVLQLIMASEKTLFLGLIAFRIINALVLQTAYVPDEFWQSVEVSHNMAFGYGYMTWEWRHGLRGYIYPLVFAFFYKVIGILHLDSRILLIKLPRIIQGVFAATGDLYLYKLSYKLSGPQVALWTLFCQLTSWFTFFCAPRTLTNSMETVITTVALFYFPWPGKPRKAQWKYVTLVGLAVIVRPTAAIVWIPFCLWHIYMYHQVAWRVVKLFAERGFIILSLSSIIDRVFYGKWVNVQYNFLEFNVLKNMGSFYGTHPWHWYLTQGFAVVMGSHVFIFLMATRKMIDKVFLGVIFWTVTVYSMLAHKEFRFIFAVVPLVMHVCGKYLDYACDENYIEQDEDDEYEDDMLEEWDSSRRGSQSSSSSASSSHRQRMKTRKLFVIVFLIATNLPVALYTCLIHQRGTMDVMKYVYDEAASLGDENIDVMFLMPCHSTPYYSFIHRNISMRFLTCEPNLAQIPGYVDEADVFYKEPMAWLNEEYDNSSTVALPTHLVMFNILEPAIQEFLTAHHYVDCSKFFHSHVPEGHVGNSVVVKCIKRLTHYIRRNVQEL